MQNDPTVLYTTNSPFEAEQIVMFLSEYDIPAMVLSQFDSAHSLLIGGLAVIKVITLRCFFEEAEHRLGEFLHDWAQSQPNGDTYEA